MVKATSRKKSHRWLIMIGLLMSAVFLFFALLPTILSTQWGKGQALGLATPHIPGEVSIDSWSLSWLGEQKLTGIMYANQQTGVHVDADQVTVAKGLASFLLDRANIGTLTVTRPEVQIALPEPETTDAKPGSASKPDKAPQDKAKIPESTTPPSPGTATVGLPSISGRLIVEQGTVAVVMSGKDAETLARDINLEVDIVSAIDPITYALAMASSDGAGTISGQGKVKLETADLSLTSIQPAGEILITDWNISQFLNLAAIYTALPTGSGSLGSKITFSGDISQGITVDGKIDLANLQLSGGPLTDDRLSVDKTSLEFSAVTRSESVELSSLRLSSPLANGSLAAQVADGGTAQFSSDLRINLPEVASQLPHTLNLQEGLQITGGMLALQVKADLDQGESRFTTNASVEGLAGVRNTKEISLAEPFTFSLNGQRGERGLNLEHFAVQSSFLNGEGQGDLNDLQLTLNADLGAALKEISKFISLSDYQAAGQLSLTFEAKRKDETTVGLSARLGAEQLAVKQGKTIIIPQSPLKLEADTALYLSPDFTFAGAAETKLSYQSWLGRGSLEGHEILLDVDSKLQKVGDLVADGQLKLHELGVMLHSLGVLPVEFTLDGNSEFKFKVSGGVDQFLIEDLAVDSPKLSLKKGKAQIIPGSALKLRGAGKVRLGSDGSLASIENPDLTYDSWIGTGKVQASSLDIATGHLTALAFEGKTDLAKLTSLLNGLEIMPPALSLGGSGTTSLAMDFSPERVDLSSLHAEIDDFILKQEGNTYQDKRLVIDTSGIVDIAKRQIALTPVHLNSVNGDISFEQLAVGDWDNLLDTLDSNGQAQFDLTTVLGAAADWISLPPDISTAAKVNLNWTADAHSSAEHRYRFNADLSNFSLTKTDIQAFNDEQVSVQMNGSRNPSNGHLTLEQFAFSSNPLTFDAAGFWNTSSDNHTELAFKGNLAMDLARIALLARTFTELDLEMAGKSERPFELAIKVSQEQREKWWQHTNFNTAFQADFIKMLGVELRSLEVPINISDGFGKAKISGKANQGSLLLQPQLDLMSNPPLLTIPENSLVLDKMQITPEMANQLLARIHPLFMGATQLSGVFDLNLERFSWPLGKENLNDLQFAGTMDFHDVRLDSSALVGSLLQVLRVNETGLDLSGRQIQFACEDGRVATNPLRTNLSDTELIISGSLGLDTTIDYLAQAEVTERLVGGDLFKYLEGTVIHIPIGGTLSKPDISAKTVERAIADLASQVGQKKLQEAAGNLLKNFF